MARLSLHLSKCYIVGNHMLRLILFCSHVQVQQPVPCLRVPCKQVQSQNLAQVRLLDQAFYIYRIIHKCSCIIVFIELCNGDKMQDLQSVLSFFRN